MNETLALGKQEGWSQAQFKQGLQDLIRNEYKDLKSGTRILNKAEDLRKGGGTK